MSEFFKEEKYKPIPKRTLLSQKNSSGKKYGRK
jgi:hypothetical protein